MSFSREPAADAANARLLRVAPRVRRLVRQLAGSDDIADLYHDALLRILESLPTYRGEGRFEAWVDAVTARVTLRTLAKWRAARRRLQVPEVAPTLSQPAVPSPHRVLFGARALDALAQVPGKQRTAIVMHHVLGMTVAEMSSELSVPIETVRSRLRVGMGQVRAQLGGLGAVPEGQPLK